MQSVGSREVEAFEGDAAAPSEVLPGTHFLPAPARERTMFIAEVTREAEILTKEGERLTVGVDYFQFGYDRSILHVRRDVVLAATVELTRADHS